MWIAMVNSAWTSGARRERLAHIQLVTYPHNYKSVISGKGRNTSHKGQKFQGAWENKTISSQVRPISESTPKVYWQRNPHKPETLNKLKAVHDAFCPCETSPHPRVTVTEHISIYFKGHRQRPR